MSAQESKTPFVIELEENAIDSLSHGIEHFVENRRAYDFKYAILHIFHSIELFFKARLAREHFTLIYERPEKTGNDQRTVNFDTLIARLKSCKVRFDESEIEHLRELQKARNNIEHHRISTTQEDVENYLGRSIKILDNFLLKELGINLQDKLDEPLYLIMQDAVYSYEERYQRALNIIQELLGEETSIGSCHEVTSNYVLTDCLECGEATVPIPNSSLEHPEQTKCYFCGDEAYYETCGRCESPIFKDEPLTEENQEGICDNCLDELCSRDD